MSDDEAAEGPAVELGEASPVPGAPLQRVAARLHWGMARSEVRRREGDTEVRTPDGPRRLGAVLDEVEVPYFESRREFVGAVRDVIGHGPVPTTETTATDGDTDMGTETDTDEPADPDAELEPATEEAGSDADADTQTDTDED